MNNRETKLAPLQMKRESNFSEHYLLSSAYSEVISASFRHNV